MKNLIRKIRKNNARFLFLIFILIILIFNSFFSFLRYSPLSNKDLPYRDQIISPAVHFEWNKTLINLGEDSGRDIVIDKNNDVFVTGKVYNSTYETFDFFVAKYENSGDQLWNTTWGGISNDIGSSIDIDSSENIYITGQTVNSVNGNYDIALLKYNKTGALKWNVTWGGEGLDAGYGVDVGDFGNVFVVGYSEINDRYGDVILLKYNNSGQLEWNKTWGGLDTDSGFDIAIDSTGNIFITGYTSSYGAVTSDIILIKFDTNGNLVWNFTWGYNLPDKGNTLIIDSSDFIYIVGSTQNIGAGNSDIVLLKFNGSGILQWNKTWGGQNYDIGYGIALDSKRNVYIVGSTKSFGAVDGDACLIKFNSFGEFVWHKIWGNINEVFPYSIAIDTTDNIFITGKTKNAGINHNIFLLKYSPLPDKFHLYSNNIFPNIDGNYTVIWTRSLDANNYTLYQYDKFITEINSSLPKLVTETTNQNFSLYNVEEGKYFYIAVAHNDYGNTTSNCFQAEVQHLPGNFTLNNISPNPNPDGTFNLTWTRASGVDNYSLYVHDRKIVEIDNNGTLITEGLPEHLYLINDLETGDYYFIILAQNEVGSSSSNCILVKVRRIPSLFSLASNAEDPDSDGNFDLIWTRSNFTHNYTIFFSTKFIGKINQSVLPLYEEFSPSFDWPTYRYKVTDWENGTYYFKIVAYNNYGNRSSECLKIIVQIPKENQEKPEDSNNEVFKINPQLYLIAAFFVLFGILVYLKLKIHKQ